MGEADTGFWAKCSKRGQFCLGMMLFDEFQALTYLAQRPEVDPERLGVFGISMGATKAWWLAALDPRVRLCIDLCCLTDFEELIRIGNLAGHGIYYYVPGLRKHFEAADINALIAPRPRLSLNGRHDLLTPPAGVLKIGAQLAPLYAHLGHSGDCQIELFDCGHEETPAMRQLVLEWFDRYLVSTRIRFYASQGRHKASVMTTFSSTAGTTTEPREKTRPDVRLLPPYHVILENDDFHSFEFVIGVLIKAIGCPAERAMQLAWKAHSEGRSVVWTGPKETAEFKAEQIQTFHEIRESDGAKLGPVGCCIEPAPGA